MSALHGMRSHRATDRFVSVVLLDAPAYDFVRYQERLRPSITFPPRALEIGPRECASTAFGIERWQFLRTYKGGVVFFFEARYVVWRAGLQQRHISARGVAQRSRSLW